MNADTHEAIVADADQWHRERRAQSLASFAPLMPLSTLAGCSVIVLFLWPVMPGALLAQWFNIGLVLIAGLGLAGFAVYRARRRERGRGVAHCRSWLVAASLAAGAFWGLTSLVLLPAVSPVQQGTLALIIAAVTALWLPLFVIERITLLTNAAPALLPMAFNLLIPPTATPLATMGSLLLLIFATFGVTAHLLRRMLDADAATRRVLYRRATHDSLVGLVNHAEFERRAALIESAAPEPYAVVFVDLDDFKGVNDTAGHLEGDRLLRDVGAILRDEKRKADVAARLGGDEFVILMQLCSDREALRVARAVSSRINALAPRGEAAPRRVTASIGIACSVAGTTSSMSVVDAADRACYAAKRAGRNRIELARHADPAGGNAQSSSAPGGARPAPRTAPQARAAGTRMEPIAASNVFRSDERTDYEKSSPHGTIAASAR